VLGSKANIVLAIMLFGLTRLSALKVAAKDRSKKASMGGEV